MKYIVQMLKDKKEWLDFTNPLVSLPQAVAKAEQASAVQKVPMRVINETGELKYLVVGGRFAEILHPPETRASEALTCKLLELMGFLEINHHD